MQVIDEGE